MQALNFLHKLYIFYFLIMNQTCNCLLSIPLTFIFRQIIKCFQYLIFRFTIMHICQGRNLFESKLFIHDKGVYFLFTESRPEERFFSKLDSSLKKNTAFVKKLVSFFLFLIGGTFRFSLVCLFICLKIFNLVTKVEKWGIRVLWRAHF